MLLPRSWPMVFKASKMETTSCTVRLLDTVKKGSSSFVTFLCFADLPWSVASSLTSSLASSASSASFASSASSAS